MPGPKVSSRNSVRLLWLAMSASWGRARGSAELPAGKSAGPAEWLPKFCPRARGSLSSMAWSELSERACVESCMDQLVCQGLGSELVDL